MAYIGNAAPSRFVSNRAASVYSGDGSTTAFTLEQAVVQDEDILVSVDGVIQEPSVGYAVSNATTLTFTGAPSSNAGNNIFVYYLASQVGTVGHPSSQALSATSGTFTGAFTSLGIDDNADATAITITSAENVGIGTASPTALSNYTSVVANNSTGSMFELMVGGTRTANMQTSASAMNIQTRTSIPMIFDTNSTEAMKIDANGIITKPLQPAFLCTPASQQSNFAVGNSPSTVAFGTEVFDQNADFASNTFTAPVTGRYQLQATLYMANIDSAAAYYEMQMITSNRIYYIIFDMDFGQDNAYFSISNSVLADMDASDTVTVKIKQSGGTAQTDITVQSVFSGYLVA